MTRLQRFLNVFGFAQRKWFRQWVGGYWALWYIRDPIHSDIWMHEQRDNPGLGGGVTEIEDYQPNLPIVKVITRTKRTR